MTGRNRTGKLFDWLNRVKADAELSPVAFMVAFEIGQHFNSRHGGAAWPGLETIARSIGVGKTTVIRTVRQLRERGHLTVEPGRAGRGHSNRYRMAKTKIKGPSVDLSEPDKRSTGDSKRSIATDLNHLEPSKETLSAFPEGERDGSRALTVSPRAPAPYGGALKDKFALLLSIYFRPYGVDEAAAWKAFVQVCGNDPDIADEVIASARRWVAARPPRKTSEAGDVARPRRVEKPAAAKADTRQ